MYTNTNKGVYLKVKSCGAYKRSNFSFQKRVFCDAIMARVNSHVILSPADIFRITIRKKKEKKFRMDSLYLEIDWLYDIGRHLVICDICWVRNFRRVLFTCPSYRLKVECEIERETRS